MGSNDTRTGARCCTIQWVAENGQPTPDNRDAIGEVRCLGYAVPENPSYKPIPSAWMPICGLHLERMPLDGRWEFRGLVR